MLNHNSISQPVNQFKQILQQNKSTFQAKVLLFMTTFRTNIGPYNLCYIILYVTLTNLIEHGNCLYLAVTILFYISFKTYNL